MKKILTLVLCTAAALFAARAETDEDARAAFIDAAAEAQAGLATAPIPAGKAVALLPVAGPLGEDWMAGLLQNAVTAAGKTCVVAKHDPAFAAILKEIEWDARKADILDPGTIDGFGALKSAQILLAATVTVAQKTAASDAVRCVFVELELHAVEIATKKHLWGGVFSKRRYLPAGGFEEADVNAIPVAIRRLMQDNLRARITESLRNSGRLDGIRTVAFLPLASDLRGYISGLVRDAVVQARLTPKNLDVQTLAEARHALRDTDAADALLYGAVRDISVETDRRQPLSEEKVYTAEVQLTLENGRTRELVWSDTILVSEKAVQDGVWYAVTRHCPALRERPWLAVAVPLGALVALVLLLKLLRAATRVR